MLLGMVPTPSSGTGTVLHWAAETAGGERRDPAKDLFQGSGKAEVGHFRHARHFPVWIPLD